MSAYFINYEFLDRLHRKAAEAVKAGIPCSLKLKDLPYQYHNYSREEEQVLLTDKHFSICFAKVESTQALENLVAKVGNIFRQTDFNLSESEFTKELFNTPALDTIVEESMLKTPSVKFFSTALQYIIGDNEQQRWMRVINNRVQEFVSGGKTHRMLRAHDVFFCANDGNPIYNYLDNGHILLFTKQNGKDFALVLSQLTVETAYLAALFYYSPALVIQNMAVPFCTPVQARTILFKLEKLLTGDEKRNYTVSKGKIEKEFNDNGSNVLIAKLYKEELVEVTINEVKITKDSFSYETVSLKHEGLAKKVFSTLDPDSPFDIYGLVNHWASLVEKEMSEPFNLEKAKESKLSRRIDFSINGIPISVTMESENTRRWVNGNAIKKDELTQVLNRATCHTDAEEYERFLKSVTHQSLEVHDILANGLPIHIRGDQSHDVDYYHTDKFKVEKHLPFKYPKMYFRRKDDKYYLIVKSPELDKERAKISAALSKEEVEQEENTGEEQLVCLKSFVGFVRRMGVYNRQRDGGTDYNLMHGHTRNDLWISAMIKHTIREHTIKDEVGANVLTRVTDDMFDLFITAAEKARKKAAAKSEELLKKVTKELNINKLDWSAKGSNETMSGYEVIGKLSSYFVNEVDNRVWNMKTGRYVCIVNSGEMGAGKDALIARLYALKNDSIMAAKINTLGRNDEH